jgi:hypothetical protein
MSLDGKRMELNVSILSEISQFHKDKYHVFSHLWKLGGETKANKQKGKVMKVKGGLPGRWKEGGQGGGERTRKTNRK